MRWATAKMHYNCARVGELRARLSLLSGGNVNKHVYNNARTFVACSAAPSLKNKTIPKQRRGERFVHPRFPPRTAHCVPLALSQPLLANSYQNRKLHMGPKRLQTSEGGPLTLPQHL